MGPVRPERCASCHAKEAQIRHAPVDKASDCSLCHRFTDALPKGIIEALTAGKPLPAHAHQPGDCAHCHLTRQGETPGVEIHATEKCSSCHRPHEDAKPESAPCSSCHEQVATRHALTGKTANQVCTTCHQMQHAPASDALRTCTGCHFKEQPLVPATALFADGHTECVGCHRPHDFSKGQTEPCRTCHANVVVLAQATVPAHQQCTSCHTPHDVRGSPDRACARCHSNEQSDHPQHGAVGSCVGCHDPHPSFGHRNEKATPCSSCHQAARQDTAFHAGVACQRCHAPHDFVRSLSDQRACESCHARQVASAAHSAGHQNCQACHRGLPHQPLLPIAGCETCHQSQHERVNAGHSKCTSCHEPHSGSKQAPCGSCHEREQTSAPTGHQTCTSCHDAHSGSHPAPCAKCHETQAVTAHGKLSNDCRQCHRPHGPSGLPAAPPCASCHQRQQLAGLHQTQKHAPCEQCHTGHGEARGARHDVCLGCHTDLKKHFADAPSCTSCHLFNKNR